MNFLLLACGALLLSDAEESATQRTVGAVLLSTALSRMLSEHDNQTRPTQVGNLS